MIGTHSMSDKIEELTFLESGHLGVFWAKRYLKFKVCQDCSRSELRRSRKEEEELDMLKKSIKIENQELVVKYPYIKDPSLLPYMKIQVLKMATKLENILEKENMLESYNKKFQKYLDRKAFVEITKNEKENYKGPVQFISHHGVLSSSTTTLLKIVTNASLKNGSRIHNDCLPKFVKLHF